MPESGPSTSARLRLALKPEIALAALLALGLVLRLRLAWADLYTLVLDATSDDAYYYFQIARNLVAGRGVTFDGETPTNGFHPLWLVLVTPIYGLSDDPVRALHWILTLAAAFATGTIALVYACTRSLTANPWAALVAAGATALHPYLVRETANGMETALTVFFVALTTWLFLRIATRPAPAPLARYAGLGLAAGLAMLARTDNVFLMPPLLLFAWLRERAGWAAAFVTGAVASLVVAPWLVWNLVQFGTLMQISGVAIAEFERQHYLAQHGRDLATLLARGWEITRQAFAERLMHLYFVPRDASPTPFLWISAGVLVSLLLAPLGPARRSAARQVGWVMVPGSGIVAILLYHGGVRWWLREWYFAPLALLAALLLGIAVAYADGLLRGAHRPAKLAVLYGLVVGLLATAFGPHTAERWGTHSPHRVNQLEAARWIAFHTDPRDRIGSFNAGLIGYFSERTVVNLDGVVNADAYGAKVERRMMDYIQSKDLRYLADFAGALRQARCDESPGAHCERVARVGKPIPFFGGGQIHILEVKRDGS